MKVHIRRVWNDRDNLGYMFFVHDGEPEAGRAKTGSFDNLEAALQVARREGWVIVCQVDGVAGCNIHCLETEDRKHAPRIVSIGADGRSVGLRCMKCQQPGVIGVQLDSPDIIWESRGR